MLAIVKCNKCGETGKIDVRTDAKTVEEAQALIDKVFKVESCPFGNHVELSQIKYTVTGMEEGAALSDEEAIAEMEAKGYKCWTDTADTPKGIEITSFAMGCPIASCNGEKGFWMDFRSLPSGRRVWYCRADDYEARMGIAPQSVEV